MRRIILSVALIALSLTVANLVTAQPPVRLVPASAEQQYRQAFPAVDDEDIAELLASDDLVFYTEREIPKAYQNDNTFHSPYYNISGEPDPFGNGNREFPWNEAGGAHNVRNLEVFRFIKFPKKKDGSYWPVVYWNERLPVTFRDGNGSTWRWRYPNGTVIGELMGIKHKNGYTYPFELRLRMREGSEWGVDVFRPFPTADDLAKRVKELRPEWQRDPELSRLMSHLTQDWKFPTVTMRDNSGRGFSTTAKVHPLPAINDDDLVARLLVETRWYSALGEDWKSDAEKGAVTAPTVNPGTGFHIVPERYAAHGFGVDRYECIQCHQHTNKAVAAFTPNRGWYGRIRGSDGIFSFHPIARSSISGNGSRIQVRMNPALVSAGLVERYNPSRHPKEMYTGLDSDFYKEGQ